MRGTHYRRSKQENSQTQMKMKVCELNFLSLNRLFRSVIFAPFRFKTTIKRQLFEARFKENFIQAFLQQFVIVYSKLHLRNALYILLQVFCSRGVDYSFGRCLVITPLEGFVMRAITYRRIALCH